MQKSGTTSTSGGTDTEDQVIRKAETRTKQTAGLSPTQAAHAWMGGIDVMVMKITKMEMEHMEAILRIRQLHRVLEPPLFMWIRNEKGRLVKQTVPRLWHALQRLSGAAKATKEIREKFYEKNSDYGLDK